MSGLQSFVVDSDGWDHAELVEACRVVLSAAAATAAKYRIDVPVADDEWPPEVLAAAEILRGAASRTGRVEKSGYARTGRVAVAADETWAAFLVFAPWAYDATVWNAARKAIVDLADEGRSIVVRLDDFQVESLGQALGAARLVPAKAWRKVRKERRRR